MRYVIRVHDVDTGQELIVGAFHDGATTRSKAASIFRVADVNGRAVETTVLDMVSGEQSAKAIVDMLSHGKGDVEPCGISPRSS